MESQQSDNFKQPNCYLAWDQRGNTQIVKNPYDISIFNHAFIRIHYERPPSSTKDQLFVDREFEIKSGIIQQLSDEEVIIERISNLYPSRHGQALFSQQLQPKRLKDYNELLPHLVYQMYLLEEISFKRLFITQRISKQGRYDVLVNKDGYFEVQTVDDIIPILKKSQRPIWQLDAKQPWQLILTKLWAKKQGGYEKIKNTKPFQFISYFTPCTWKYINLVKEGRQFLTNYSNKVPDNCRIFVKSKLEKEVERAGLISDRVVYELIEFDQFEAKGKKEFNLLIKSVVPHQWTGSLSIFDKEFINIFKRLKNDFQLESTFLINQPDFFNIFSRAFVTTSKNSFPEFITSQRLVVPKNNRSPSFFEFTTLTKGYLILTIRQDQQNKKRTASSNGAERVRLSTFQSIGECPAGQRYLEVKFILAKVNKRSQQELKDSFVRQMERKRKKELKLSPGKEQKQFKHLEYILQDFDYTRGKNKGEAHPIQIGPGTYIMRIITEKTYNQSTFNIQCISHQNISINPIYPAKEAQLTMLKDSLLSVSHTMPTHQLSDKVAISFGFQFDTIGYGFVAIQTEKDLQKALVVRVDPMQVYNYCRLLMREGYKLKMDYQSNKQVFSKQLKGYESEVFIFERFEEVVKEYVWPPSAFKFFMSQK